MRNIQFRYQEKDLFVKLATKKKFSEKKEYLTLIEYSKQRQCSFGKFQQLFVNKNFCM